MKFDKSIKIELAASKDDARPVLQYIHYNHSAHRLEACDGFMLAVLAVTDDEQDEDALIPAACVTEARKLAAKGFDCEIHTQGNECIVPGGATRLLGEGTFPDVQKIIPDAVWDKSPFLTVSSKFLETCSKVFGGDGILLTRLNVKDPMLVEGRKVKNAFMFLMPMIGAADDKKLLKDESNPTLPARLRGKRKEAKRAAEKKG